ncbi:DUF6616 family protein [Casimicrobium huifangae]|jgi:hypothetical protein|uniref:DUF6616 family protein n=1 Tax=Casimicrobium huifangae TaxID=2591109 RepID=UPI00307F8A38
MQVFIGMWKPRNSWHALSQAERTAYLSKVTALTRLRLGPKAESVAWGENNHAATAEQWKYFCVWRFANTDVGDAYLQVLAENGWNDYFDTESLRGEPKTPFDVMTRHVMV